MLAMAPRQRVMYRCSYAYETFPGLYRTGYFEGRMFDFAMTVRDTARAGSLHVVRCYRTQQFYEQLLSVS